MAYCFVENVFVRSNNIRRLLLLERSDETIRASALFVKVRCVSVKKRLRELRERVEEDKHTEKNEHAQHRIEWTRTHPSKVPRRKLLPSIKLP